MAQPIEVRQVGVAPEEVKEQQPEEVKEEKPEQTIVKVLKKQESQRKSVQVAKQSLQRHQVPKDDLVMQFLGLNVPAKKSTITKTPQVIEQKKGKVIKQAKLDLNLANHQHQSVFKAAKKLEPAQTIQKEKMKAPSRRVKDNSQNKEFRNPRNDQMKPKTDSEKLQ